MCLVDFKVNFLRKKKYIVHYFAELLLLLFCFLSQINVDTLFLIYVILLDIFCIYVCVYKVGVVQKSDVVSKTAYKYII